MTITKEAKERIRAEKGLDLVMEADEAAGFIEAGMVLGVSGFTLSGYPKLVPGALVKRVENGEDLKIDLYSGASVGPEIDTAFAEHDMIGFRYPYITNSTLRKKVNLGQCDYVDAHLSHSAQFVKYGFVPKVDVALVEAIAIDEDGNIIPTTSVGNSPVFVDQADKVIVELNVGLPMELEGMHDIVVLPDPPERKPLNICKPEDRIGTPYIPCSWDKICAIVISDAVDDLKPLKVPNEDHKKIAENILQFLRDEIAAGRMDETLLPLQSGVGSVANAVLYGLLDSEFHDLTCYTEVVQDSMLELLKSGKARFASTTSITPSPEVKKSFDRDIDIYKDKILFRPQDISNSPEVIRRLGVIAMNTALEVDIYGNVNSTHVNGSSMMNGIGGSGDFARNAYISIFSTESVAHKGDISSIVPFCSHIDHTEHDVQVIVTEQGYADLRGLTPKERAMSIIENCAHPDYRQQLMDYFNRACEAGKTGPKGKGGMHTPHLLDEALSWHKAAADTGTMKK